MQSAIIQQILRKHNISDIQQASDDKKLVIYTQAIRRIKEGLENWNPNDVPKRSLMQYGDALNEISIAFSYLGNTPVGEKYKIKNRVSNKVNKMLSCISKIKAIMQKNEGKNYKTTEYFNKLIELRAIIIEVYEYLRDE